MHEPHSLKKYCIFALIKAKRHLGDVGYLDVESLQAVLFHCSVEELRSIEDSTLEGSNRDLSWYTWHMWLDHYRLKFGQPRADFEPPELLTDPPEDYVPIVTDPAPADWRSAYFAKREANEEKISKLGREVKEMYQAAQQERESKQAQVCPKMRGDSVRRRGPNVPGIKRPPPTATPAAQQKFKLLKTIGLTHASPPSSRPPPRKITVTRTTVPSPHLHPSSTPLRPLSHRPVSASPHLQSTSSRPVNRPAPPPSTRPSPPPSSKPSLGNSRPLTAPPSNKLPHPSMKPSSHPRPTGAPPSQLPAKGAAPSKSPPLYSKPAPPSSASAPQLPEKGNARAPNSRPLPGAATTKMPGTSRLLGSSHTAPPASRPAPRPTKGLVRHTDAELEAELARRRGHGGSSGLQIADDEDDW